MTSFKQVYKVLPRYENGQAQAGVALKSTGGTPFKALSHISRENRECIVIIKDNKSNNLKGSDYIYESDWNNTKSESGGVNIERWIKPLKEYEPRQTPRSQNLEDKRKVETWIKEHPQAGYVFESVNKYLKSRYTGEDHGYTEDGVKYRFNRKPKKCIRVEGQVRFTTVTMFSDEDATNPSIKIENEKFEKEEEYKQKIFQLLDNFLIENKISGFDYNLQLEKENVQAIVDDIDSFINSIPDGIPETEREALIKIRIGQSKFRDGLIEYWDSKCSVTECAKTRILIASHIKPWRDCIDDAGEKLDVMNGLLLIPNLDALFDKGFISFDDDGEIIISPQLSEDDQERLDVNNDMVLRKTLSERHKIYLKHHREYIFQE